MTGRAKAGKAKPRTVKGYVVVCSDGRPHCLQLAREDAVNDERFEDDVEPVSACGPHHVRPFTGTFTPQPARAKARKGERSR